MEGLTSVIVLFIFACFIYRDLVRHRPQFYAAFACVLVVILFNTLAATILNVNFTRFVLFLTGVLQAAAILLLAMSVGGLSASAFAGEARGALDALRRGGDDRPVIVPLTGEVPKAREYRDDYGQADVPPVVSPAPRAARREEGGSIPLE